VSLLVLAAGPAAGQGRQRVLLVDHSPLTVSTAKRRQVLDGMQSTLETGGFLVAQRDTGRPGSTAKAMRQLLARAKTASQQFREQEALKLLNSGEQTFIEGYGRGPTVKPLIRILLARARLNADLGQQGDMEQDLARAAVLNPELTLDPGVFPPALVATFRRIKQVVTRSGGTLSVSTTPAALPVWVDGRRRGKAPLTVELPAGLHFVAVGPLGATRGRTITVSAGKTSQLSLGVRRPRLTDERLRKMGQQADASWVVAVRLIRRGAHYQITARALPIRLTNLPRALRSNPVGPDRLTWATSQLSVQLQGVLAGSTATTIARPQPVVPVVTRSSDGSVLKSWWFWTLVAAVVGGGTAAAVVFTRDNDPGVRVTLER